MKLIDEMNINNNLKWIEYETIKFYVRQIINKNNENLQDKGIDNLIKYIIEEEEESKLTEVIGVENKKEDDELDSENSINEIKIEQKDNSKDGLSEDDENEENEGINIINNNSLDINNLNFSIQKNIILFFVIIHLSLILYILYYFCF